MISGIYRIRNIGNNKCYFGQSQDIEKRIKQHYRKLQKGQHVNRGLQRDYSFNPQNFEWEVFEDNVSIENLNEREREYLSIAEKYPMFYYNICYYPETTRGVKATEESRKKISAAMKIAQNRPEVKAKHKAAMKAAMNRPEVKAKRSAALKIANNRPEVKAKISAAKKDSTIYSFYNKKTNESFIGTQYDFYKKYNQNQGNVSGLIKDKYKSVKDWIILKSSSPLSDGTNLFF